MEHTAIKSNGAGAYIIFGIFFAVVCILVIPLIDALTWPGVTYGDGFRSAFTYLWGIGVAALFAFYLYRCDRRNAINAGREETGEDITLD